MNLFQVSSKAGGGDNPSGGLDCEDCGEGIGDSVRCLDDDDDDCIDCEGSGGNTMSDIGGKVYDFCGGGSAGTRFFWPRC